MSEDRRNWIGGSDVASIFGVSPWKTALELFEEKTAPEFIPPEVTPEREKLYRRGKKLEPWVLEMLQEEHPITVIGRNLRFQDKLNPWMSCEEDFECIVEGETCNGEIKTVSPFAAGEWGEQGSDEIPIAYCLQVLYGLMLTGRKNAVVAALIGADDLRLYHVTFDEELAAEIRKRVVQFWTGHVIPKVPPPVQTIADVNRVLARHGGFVLQGEESIWNAIRDLRMVKADVKAADERKKELELQIKKYFVMQAEALGMTDAPKKFSILGPDGKQMCSVAMQHRSAYSVEATDFLVMRT